MQFVHKSIATKSRKICSVPQCSSYCTKDVSLHTFPTDSKFCQIWQTVLKIEKPVSKYMLVCSQHFIDNDFMPATNKRRRLKQETIPSQKIPQTSNFTKSLVQKQTMVSCAACGCSQTKNIKALGISFHRFPKDIHRKQAWINFVNRNDWTPKVSSVLCSQHFTDEFYDRTSQLVVRLQPNALPTIIVDRLKYVRSFNTVHARPIETAVMDTSSSCNELIQQSHLSSMPNVKEGNFDQTVTHLLPKFNNSIDQDLQIGSKIVIKEEPELEFDKNEVTTFSTIAYTDNVLNKFDNNINEDFYKVECKIEIKEEPLCETNVSAFLEEKFDIDLNEISALPITANEYSQDLQIETKIKIEIKEEPTFQENEDLIDEKSYNCQECNQAFYTPINLKLHKCNHTEKKSYSCKQCGEFFARASTLIDHEKLHSGEKPYKCNHCEKTFAQTSTLRKHERLHTGEKPYKCKQCGNAFSRSCSLKNHERIHTGEKPFACKYCGKTFANKCNSKAHELTHTGGKSYSCRKCGKMFFNRYYLKKHEFKKHIGKKPHRCIKCGKAFIQSCNLKTHEKSCQKGRDNIPEIKILSVNKR